MSLPRPPVLAALAVALVAGVLRFACLGTWSFAVDEQGSLAESAALLDGAPVTDDPATKLPRLTPVPAALHGLSYRLLGRTEFAARLPAAVLGTALCGLAVVGLWGTLGGWGAVATGLLLAVNPEYVFHAQNNRFYTTAAFFGAAAVLASGVALRRRSVAWMGVAAGCVLVGTFAHTLVALMVVGLAVVALLTPTGSRRGRRGMILVVAVTAAALVVVGGLYIYPLAKGWNAAAGWGYSLPRAVLGGVNGLGWPVALLAGLGAVLMTAAREAGRWFWLLWAAGWAAALVVLPLAVTYHPGYGFVFQFGPMALAGYAVGELGRGIRQGYGPRAAVAWVGAAVLLNLPSLASHYVDGSRPDQRGAASFVASHRGPGEAVYAASPAYLTLYAPSELGDARPLRENALLKDLEAVATGKGPAWLVLPAGRSGRPADVQAWLNDHCKLAATFRKTRFDYYEFTLDVYKFEPR